LKETALAVNRALPAAPVDCMSLKAKGIGA
jgi:hypothetical protein